MNRKQKKIFTSLVINYIVFVAILILLLALTVFFAAVLINKNVVANPGGALLPERIFYLIIIKAGLFFLVLFILSIILFSLWTSKKIIKPLRRITEAMEIVTKGNYDTKLDFKAEKEFATIRDDFNYMVERLKKVEYEKKEMEQRKISMLVSLSHDIKTPITTIMGFSKALSEGLIREEDKKNKYYAAIFNKATKVSELTSDLFEFVKLESVEYKLKLVTVDYVEFIRKILAEHYEEIEEKNFELNLKLPEREIMINIDNKLMTRAISNIIDNALKHNPRGTKLRLEIEEEDEYVVLDIADNGLGIPERINTQVFDAFVKGDESRKSCDGSGLGLSIAKMIIEKHGGKISLKKSTKDEKTIFSIALKK